MKNLLLTSTGLSNNSIVNAFLKVVDKPVDEINIGFIPTAARTDVELQYSDMSKKELLGIGIQKSNINVINVDREIAFEEIKGNDVMYVCGGNTFYLMKRIREFGFDRVINDFIKLGKLYLGVSAGSIIVCPSIEIALPFDENDVGLKDFSGLGLTDIVVSPHYTDDDKVLIDDYRKKNIYDVITLTDNQALLIDDKNLKIIE